MPNEVFEVPQLKAAQELGEQLVSLARKTNDRLLLAEAHLLLGFTVFFRRRLPQPEASHASEQGPSRLGLYGYDPRVPCWFVMACALWVLGYPDQATYRA